MRYMPVNQQKITATQSNYLWMKTVSDPSQPVAIVGPAIFTDGEICFGIFFLPGLLNLVFFKYNEGFKLTTSTRYKFDDGAKFFIPQINRKDVFIRFPYDNFPIKTVKINIINFYYAKEI